MIDRNIIYSDVTIFWDDFAFRTEDQRTGNQHICSLETYLHYPIIGNDSKPIYVLVYIGQSF